MNQPIPLPIHFKLPGRSYSQIGRKGNIALYSVHSDYLILPDYALPFVLIGYELIAIKIKDGREIYPSAWQFGESAWSIPKSWARACSSCFGRSLSRFSQLFKRSPQAVPNRSTSPQPAAALAPSQPATDQAAQKALEWGTIVTQRRVTLRLRLFSKQPPTPRGVGGDPGRRGAAPRRPVNSPPKKICEK